MSVILFVHGEPKSIGGMEEHGWAMVQWMSQNGVKHIVVRSTMSDDAEAKYHVEGGAVLNLEELKSHISPAVLFHNTGHLIEYFKDLKSAFPDAIQVYRTGGNEVLQASLHRQIPQHNVRQKFWVDSINEAVDILVTNSEFTERRYAALGISKHLFLRAVGGASPPVHSHHHPNPEQGLTLFCAARFVAYKNHFKLIDLIGNMVQNRIKVNLRLAGDGPLFERIKSYVAKLGLESNVEFLGAISPERVAKVLAISDVYVQLSIDEERFVEGGTYIHTEGMGRSVLAAIGSGTWVLAGKAGALPEIVHGSRGVIVDPYNIDATREALEEWIAMKCPTPQQTDEYAWEHYFKKYRPFIEVNF